MPAIQNRRWTAAEVRRLIDEHPEPVPRMELVDGELLVTPSPGVTHQRIVFELAILLNRYVQEHLIGEVRISPAELRLVPEQIVQPDVFVVAAPDRARTRGDVHVMTLLLAVEVLSPGSIRFDRVTKRKAYQANGVAEYWIVDGDAETIERWRPADERPEILDRDLAWHPVGAPVPMVVDIIGLFAAIREIDRRMS